MPAMPAVANGERVEQFSSIKKNGAADDDELNTSAEMESALHVVGSHSETDESHGSESCSEKFNGKRVQNRVYSKPCPKSMKVKENVLNSDSDPGVEQGDVESQNANSQEIQEKSQDISGSPKPDSNQTVNQQNDSGMTEELENNETEALLEENDGNAKENDQPDTSDVETEKMDVQLDANEVELEQNNIGDDETIEERNSIEGALEEEHTENGGDSPSEFQIQESDEPATDEDKPNDYNGCPKNKPDFEGIVSEPDDRTDKSDQESAAMSDADVTISSVDFDESGSKNEYSEVDVCNAEDQSETRDPLVEFPLDLPEDNDPYDDDSMEGSLVADVIVTEDVSTNGEQEEIEEPDKTADMPTQYTDTRDLHFSSNIMTALKKDASGDFSFGRSLRSMSGRRAMSHDTSEISQDPTNQQGDIVTSTNSSKSSIFSFNFGKRKLENREVEDIPAEQESKRVKAEEGVEPQGFFARLTSPVMNRLRAIKVGSSGAGEEVNSHQEMAVALIAPPPSKRCIIM